MVLPELGLRLVLGLESGVADRREPRSLLLVARHLLGLRLERRVDRVVRQGEKEGPVPVPLDEVERHVGQPVGEIRALRVPFEVGHIGDGPIRVLVRREVGAGLARVVHGEGEVEALDRGKVQLGAQVPLAHVPGRVSRLPKRLADSGLFQRKLAHVVSLQQETVLLAADPVGEIEARGMFAGHQAGPRGRAHGTGRVELREPRAVGPQPVDVGGLVEAASVDAGVRPAQVVDHDQDDVQRRARGPR